MNPFILGIKEKVGKRRRFQFSQKPFKEQGIKKPINILIVVVALLFL